LGCEISGDGRILLIVPKTVTKTVTKNLVTVAHTPYGIRLSVYSSRAEGLLLNALG
jgi:hypothetical protein